MIERPGANSSHTVRVEPAGIDIEVRPGETLFDAAWREGYEWPTVCMGQMLCTACHVIVCRGAENTLPIVQKDEHSAIRRVSRRLYAGQIDGVRLACQLEVRGPVTVRQAVFHGKRLNDT
jgi:ferredoxin, 2Fe-2S